MSDLDSLIDEQDLQERYADLHSYSSHDGNRSLLQNENRRNDNLKDRFIGAIDTGTTSSRFIIFDCTGVPVAKYQTEFRQIHEHSGYVLLFFSRCSTELPLTSPP